jgi:hypothetical protein
MVMKRVEESTIRDKFCIWTEISRINSEFLMWVRVNQRLRFPPNVFHSLLSAPLPACWLYAESGTLRKTYTFIYQDPYNVAKN